MGKAPGLMKLQQGKILAYANIKMSIRDIAKAVGRSKTIVHAFLKNLDAYGAKKSPGRPRKMKTHDLTRLKRYAATGEFTAHQLHQELGVDASVHTVQRELQQCDNLVYMKANKSSCMTNKHKKQQFGWAECQIRQRTDWSRVVFSDKKKLNLDGPNGCKYYWYNLRNEKKVRWSRHAGGGSAMVWGGMSSLGKTRLTFLKGNQDAFDYQQTLTSHLFEFTDNVHGGDYVFQHDNTSIHRANATKSFLADLNVKTMDWPALSPDQNPIENLWGIMVRRVYKNARQYFSTAEFKIAIQLVWDETSDDLLLKLTNSMFDRCLAVVRSKGTKIAC